MLSVATRFWGHQKNGSTCALIDGRRGLGKSPRLPSHASFPTQLVNNKRGNKPAILQAQELHQRYPE